MVSNKKSGFTLVELMFFFLFVTLILAASTPLITKKFKEIPEKINHGMFLCYYNNGSLTQDYYNAVRKVSSVPVTECSFKPPKKAALFKIELYGAGAGGYTYHEIPADVMKEYDGYYDMSSGLQKNYYEEPKDGDLQYMFNNEVYQAVQSSGGGESGGYVKYDFPDVSKIGCSSQTWDDLPVDCEENYYNTVNVKDADGKDVLDENGNVKTKKVINTNSCTYLNNQARERRNSRLSAAKNSFLSGCNNCSYHSSVHDTRFDGICSDWGGMAGVPVTRGVTARGALGGSAMNIVYNNKINFNDVPLEQTKSHLKMLWDSISKGTATAPGAGFIESSSKKWIDNGKQGDSIDTVNGADYGFTPSDRNVTNGRDVLTYGAIKVESDYVGSCICTNRKRATGGDGAQIHIATNGCITHKSTNRGVNASGLVKTGSCLGKCFDDYGNAKEMRPRMLIDSFLNTRTHVVGNGGGRGEYKLVQAQSLPDDCKFNLGIGGPTIVGEDGTITKPEDLSTSLVCNEGDYVVSVVGGTQEKSTKTVSYDGMKQVHNPQDVFKTTGTAGEASLYKRERPFTVYVLPDIAPGAGGSGSSIADTCVDPYGYYIYTMSDAFDSSKMSKVKNYTIKQQCTPEGAYITNTPASSGAPGAIIISW